MHQIGGVWVGFAGKFELEIFTFSIYSLLLSYHEESAYPLHYLKMKTLFLGLETGYWFYFLF